MNYNYNYCSAYKSSAAEALLAERGRIDSSHQMIDATLECALVHLLFTLRFFRRSLRFMYYRQAHETRAEFGRQRSSLGSIQTRMVGVLSKLSSMPF
jgi:Golgi SNAP receptor complex protein 1